MTLPSAKQSFPSLFLGSERRVFIPSSTVWPIPVQHPVLQDTEIHLWRVCLSEWLSQRAYYESIVSTDECQRAARFKFEHLRHRFIVGRGILRELLGRYLAIAPAHIQFTYGPYGKPSLDPTRHPHRLSFNVSHSNAMALFAFCRQGAIGVDIEHIRRSPDVFALSKRFFTLREHQLIRSCSSEQAVLNFFRIWTCKEAYLKATGEGLAGLQTVEVDCQFHETDSKIRFLRCSTPAQDSMSYSWEAAQCWPESGYVGAIALGRLEERRLPWSSSASTAESIHTFSYGGL